MKQFILGVTFASLVGLGYLATIAHAANTTIESQIIVANIPKVIATTDAGKDMNAKLAAMAKKMSDSLNAEGTAIESDAKTLQQTPAAQVQTDKFRQQKDSLEQRLQAFQGKKLQAANDIQATRQDALLNYQNALDPVVKSVVANHKSMILLDASIVTYASPAIDVTDELIVKMNSTTKTIPVSLKSSDNATPQPVATTPPKSNKKKKK